MERLEIDGDIDIMAAVRQLQIRRPQCLPSKSQYVFCYQLVKEYLEADTVYANVWDPGIQANDIVSAQTDISAFIYIKDNQKCRDTWNYTRRYF